MRLRLLFKYPFILLVVVLTMGASTAFAQTTSFTYQGRLTDGGTAANGNYDLQFVLFDSLLGGIAASQYVQTNDSRLSDARTPTPGSANYIQNTTSPQASSNFNISGNGTAGGTLNGNVVNATTQFNLSGSRILSNAGTNNILAGIGAGAANTTGA